MIVYSNIQTVEVPKVNENAMKTDNKAPKVKQTANPPFKLHEE